MKTNTLALVAIGGIAYMLWQNSGGGSIFGAGAPGSGGVNGLAGPRGINQRGQVSGLTPYPVRNDYAR